MRKIGFFSYYEDRKRNYIVVNLHNAKYESRVALCRSDIL